MRVLLRLIFEGLFLMSGVPSLRPAKLFDAPLLAKLVNYAGEGLPLYLWTPLANPGESPWDVGRRRAAREEGSFSYRNATVIELDGKAAGCLVGYDIPDEVAPIPENMPDMFRPLQELENLVPGTWYVNVLAVLPEARNKGLGTNMLAEADRVGAQRKKRGMSVIVSDANSGARRLYEKCGYFECARRDMVKEDWQNEGAAWLLLKKDF